MKKYIIILIALIGLVSCADFLDPKLSTERNYDQMLTQPDQILGLVSFAYRSFPNSYDHFGNDFLDCATDNGVSNNQSGNISKISEIGSYWNANRNPLNVWGSRYEEIMSINHFWDVMEEVGPDYVFKKSSVYNDSIVKQTIRGEAYFLRAWCHFDLLRRFGGLDVNDQMMGVPVVKEWLSPEDFMQLPRNTYIETVEAIAEDLDSALNYLPVEWTVGTTAEDIDHMYLGDAMNSGRPTQVACHALKSRLFLYAASPAFSEGLGADEVKSLYMKSAEASKRALDIIGFDYTSSQEIYIGDADVSARFFNDPENDELILRRASGNGTAEGSKDNNIEKRHFIPSLYGSGKCNPSQNLVDAFPMANGYPITDSRSGYDPDYPYTNRDPRFYQTVLYDGSYFAGNPVETFNGGKDYNGGSDLANVNTSTRTGYYLRKWLSDQVRLQSGQELTANHYFALFRKVEMHLNFAEALTMAEGTGYAFEGYTAKDAVKALSIRANYSLSSHPYLDEVAGSTDSFMKYLKNERRIELCFEGGHRFFDLRRWKDKLNEPIKYIDIPYFGAVGETKTLVTPAFKEDQFYCPLPQSDISIMPNLTQNKGW